MSEEMKIPAIRVLPLAIIEALNEATGSNEWQGDESPATLIGPAVAAITRLSTPERDLRRFPDAAFNEWLEESITENGEFTVRDSMKDLDSAYSAWCARPYYAASPPPPEDGWKLLKDSTHAERSWPEDAAHENGNYFCNCATCLRQFIGHKRRVTCKVCAATSLSPPSADGGWRPIETAPKDGTDILVWTDVASVPVVHIAWWRNLADEPDFTAEDVGWWSYTRNSVTQEQLDSYRRPTHWMPLPPTPAALEPKEQHD